MALLGGALLGGALLPVAPAAFAEVVWESDDLKMAPPPFGPDNSYVPIDISTIYVKYNFGSGARGAEATVTWKQGQDGKPFFDMVPNATELTVNGEKLDASLFKEVKPPSGNTTLRIIDKVFKGGEEHVAVIKYRMLPVVRYSENGVNIGFFMADNASRKFFEKFGPANLQYDAIQFTFEVKVGGNTPHQIFENGVQEKLGTNHWKVTYPATYNSAALYFHLVPTSSVKVKTAVFKGLEREIPVTVYSKDQNVGAFLDKTIKKLEELEGHFGASPHPKYVVYAVKAGGMEHAGATISNDYALHHELTHSWFARSVMPADGNSAWIDEGIAVWQDAKYMTGQWPPVTKPANLGNISPYFRATPSKSNYEGRMLFAGLHGKMAKTGGMFAGLKALHDKYEMSRITNQMLEDFLTEYTGQDMAPIFKKYIYNNGDTLHTDRLPKTTPIRRSRHPRRLTDAEMYELQ